MSYDYLRAVELSDVGRQRQRNEDTTLLVEDQGVYAVFDGMGGAKGGGEASRTAAESLRRKLAGIDQHSPSFTSLKGKVISIRGAMNEASREIRARAESQGVSGAGTTAVIIVFDSAQPRRAIVLHAGDSRAYRFRDGQLGQLTRDHSFAVAAGVHSEHSLPPMFRGVVTRAVGLEKDVVLEETLVDILPGDLFLLCTDGLTKMITDTAIRDIIGGAPRDLIAQAGLRLIEAANRAGGQDNVSVMLIGVGGDLPAAKGSRHILNLGAGGPSPFETKAVTEMLSGHAIQAVEEKARDTHEKKKINKLILLAYALAVLTLIMCLWWFSQGGRAGHRPPETNRPAPEAAK